MRNAEQTAKAIKVRLTVLGTYMLLLKKDGDVEMQKHAHRFVWEQAPCSGRGRDDHPGGIETSHSAARNEVRKALLASGLAHRIDDNGFWLWNTAFCGGPS